MSWSAPNLIVAPSARNKSDHSSDVDPNAVLIELKGEERLIARGVKAHSLMEF